MFFIIYNNYNEPIAYLENLEELANYTSLRKKYLNSEFKKRNCINYINKNSYFKIYKFQN